MTGTTPTMHGVTARNPDPRPLLKAGIPAVLLAGVATTTIAAVGRAAGISLNIAAEPIPVAGFGFLTVVFGLVGVVLAVALSRWARRPRRTFLRATAALTALSLVPDVLADADGSTRALLMATHLVAAGVVVPAVARALTAQTLDGRPPRRLPQP